MSCLLALWGQPHCVMGGVTFPSHRPYHLNPHMGCFALFHMQGPGRLGALLAATAHLVAFQLSAQPIPRRHPCPLIFPSAVSDCACSAWGMDCMASRCNGNSAHILSPCSSLGFASPCRPEAWLLWSKWRHPQILHCWQLLSRGNCRARRLPCQHQLSCRIHRCFCLQ
jgi:hypothetical protein